MRRLLQDLGKYSAPWEFRKNDSITPPKVPHYDREQRVNSEHSRRMTQQKEKLAAGGWWVVEGANGGGGDGDGTVPSLLDMTAFHLSSLPISHWL